MEKVVTVSLNGNPYQFDESAFDALRAYLERAETALKDNPDRAEIIRDLEQAIADKCSPYLSAHRSVVSSSELASVLEAMGPVEGSKSGAQSGAADESAPEAEPFNPTKKLYRVRDRSSLTGVSGGLGAYFDLDPNLIRVIWILGTIFSGGFLGLAYIALMFIMPLASTPEQMAAAHGAPFRAEEVIERAKREYARFADDPPWRKSRMRRWRREWREQLRRNWRYAPPPPSATPPNPLTRVIAGFFLVLFSLISAALTLAFLVAIISLAATGAVFGFAPPVNVPIWLAIIVLVIAFAILSAPFAALRHASHDALTGAPHYYYRRGGGLVSLLFIVLIGWLAYTYVPAAHVWMDAAWANLTLWAPRVTISE